MFSIKFFIRDPQEKWYCYTICNEREKTLVNKFGFDEFDCLYICTDFNSYKYNELKIVFYDRHKVLDSLYIANTGEKPLKAMADIILPALEQKMDRFFSLWEREKVLRSLNKLEIRNKKSR